jgi:hypothetical protein
MIRLLVYQFNVFGDKLNLDYARLSGLKKSRTQQEQNRNHVEITPTPQVRRPMTKPHFWVCTTRDKADLARIDAIENPALKENALALLRERQDLREGVMGKALQYALLEEYESALESLEIGFEVGDPIAPRKSVLQVYEPLRDNPRFH